VSGERVALVWDDAFARYDFGNEHPLSPIRVELTIELIRAIGLSDTPGVLEVLPGEIDEDTILRRHRADFVEAVRRSSADPSVTPDWEYGLGPGDTPAFAGMHEASMTVCAGSREAARMVWDGDVAHAFNPAGGLHHAMPDRAAGFCIYNDPAIAIDHLLEAGAERVCYVDIDVHHGDGVEAMFADDPRVLTISLHESGRFLFPGTGQPDDIGGDAALGSVVNIPLSPGTTGAVWLDAFDHVVEPLVRAWSPDVLVTQLGCDAHATDPLAHLSLTTDDFADIVARLHTLAHEAADGKWIAMGGGGYQWVHVVPRAWTIAFAEMVGARLPIDTPMHWREMAQERAGQRAPDAFLDAPVSVAEHLDMRARETARRAVAAVRELVFPLHGLH
jgi:acetoin utilization protein AcuC